jgi:hypothetical protein
MGAKVGTLLAVWLAATAAQAAGTRVVTLDDPAQAIPGELALDFTRRLTFILPDPVRLAVPGSPDVIAAHVTDNLVTVNVVESEYVRAERPVSNLTIVTEDGTAITCRIRPAEGADASAPDVVRVERGEGLRVGIPAAAVRLLRQWLTRDADPEVQARLAPLEPLFERRGRQWVADAVAAGGLEVVPTGRRTRRDFIYLASDGITRLGGDAVVHLEVTNHSQPAFTIGEVTLQLDGRPVPADQVLVAVPDPLVPPDGKPRGVAVITAADRALSGALAVRVCERGTGPRCVLLDVREP